MKVMLLTAGQGMRLRPHTDFLPKPAIEFLNVPLFLHALEFFNSIQIKQVVMNTFHLSQVFKEKVRAYSNINFPIIFSDETSLLGSGGGINQAKIHFDGEEDFIMMNGDEFVLPSDKDCLHRAIRQHQESGAIATLLVCQHSEVGSKFGGVWVDSDNNVLGFGVKKTVGSQKGFHFIGCIILNHEIFKYFPEGPSNILYDNITQALKENKVVKVYEIPCIWFETGNEHDFKQATKMSLDLLNPQQSKLFSTESTHLKNTIKKYAPWSEFFCDEECTMLYEKNKIKDVHTLKKNFRGYNCLGQNVDWPEDLKIIDCILGSGVNLNQIIPATQTELKDKLIVSTNYFREDI